jgi:hypothetical protein
MLKRIHKLEAYEVVSSKQLQVSVTGSLADITDVLANRNTNFGAFSQ